MAGHVGGRVPSGHECNAVPRGPISIPDSDVRTSAGLRAKAQPMDAMRSFSYELTHALLTNAGDSYVLLDFSACLHVLSDIWGASLWNIKWLYGFIPLTLGLSLKSA